MNVWDEEIYKSEEYKARLERAERSLLALTSNTNFGGSMEAIRTAAESIAYWQMRAVKAEQFLLDEQYQDFRNISPRDA